MEGAGLTLLLKHMGLNPYSADLYVLSGKGRMDIESFTRDKDADNQLVAQIKAVLPSCKGSAVYAGYQVQCFHLDRDQINVKKDRSQLLGTVTAAGAKHTFIAFDFDHDTPLVKVLIESEKIVP